MVFVTIMTAGVLLAGCRTQIRETFDLGRARVVALEKSDLSVRNMKNIQLLIATPSALKSFDGQDIVIDNAVSLSYLKGAQLSDRLPDMLQARLLQAFEDTGRLGGVSRPGEGIAINYQLLSDIRRFGVILMPGSEPMASLEIGVKIVDDHNGQVRATRVFQFSAVVEGEGTAAYVQGLERALSGFLAQLVNWSFDYL